MTLVVAGDSDVNVSQRGVGVAQGDGGDVDVGRLGQGLVVGTRVGDDQEAGLPERRLDLIGEGAGGEAAVEGGGTGGGGELQHGPLSSVPGRDDADVRGVLDGDDGTGRQQQL